MLGSAWKSSQDRAWTTTADGAGFHLLTADKREGYVWKTAATLSEPGFDADMWIGNACVTGSGTRAVVVYAPRTFTNDPQLMARGGFTAVVDLTSGKVNKLDLQASLSYYNPGCGTDETAVLTQSAGQDKNETRLVKVDATTGKLSPAVVVKGQVTSAVPAGQGTVAAARGTQVLSIGAQGQTSALARTTGVPYRLVPDSQGGIVFLDNGRGAQHGTTKVKRIPGASPGRTAFMRPQPVVLAEGPVGSTGLAAGAGTVYVTGQTRLAATQLPSSVRQLAGSPKDATVTTRGEGIVSGTRWADGKDSRLQPQDATSARPVAISLSVPATDQQAAFTVDPQARPSAHAGEGKAPSPKLTAPRGRAKKALRGATAGGDPSQTPIDDDRTCSVPRNDPRNQAMQPKPRQVEWAVDQAIVGNLNAKVSRPANWKNLGMPAYQPQTLFPAPSLDGGGRVPAQVLLGVTAQESNMWQASRSAVPGVTGNPLIGNFYGINLYDADTSNDWDIHWDKADCGYGITQVTDHMRMAGREDGHGGAAWPYETQRAVALDYTVNIAAGLQILAAKWNETHAAGLTLNDGAPSRLENWYYALWAYNSGFHPQSEAGANGGAWGLGWANNPANPEWDAGRLPFMEKADGNDDAAAAAHPQNWPYPEKVLGFAAHPPAYLESPGTTVGAFRNAWWNGSDKAVTVQGSAKYNRAHVKPPEELFCDASNNCDPGRISDSASNTDAASGPCGRADFKCWWSKPATWKSDCSYSCGNEFVRFNTTYAEEADGTAYPPHCGNSDLPSTATIVDDVPTNVPSIRPNCPKYWDSYGTFTLDYWRNGVEVTYPGKADTHQLGAGFGGHFYFTHTRKDDAKGQRLKVTAKWRVMIEGQAKVMVHIPDHGAQTTQARYEIDTALGTETKVISQAGNTNRWVPLGAYRFHGPAEVRLSNITDDGTGDQDIAFDAVAFMPYTAPAAVPDVRLPDADPNAPDPEDDDTISVLSGSPAGLKASSGVTSAGSASSAPWLTRSCAPAKGKKNTTYCIGPSATAAPKGLTGKQRGLAASAATPFCSANNATRFFTRTKGCLQGLIDVEQTVNGTHFATWTYSYQQELDLDVASEKFTQKISLTPYRADPKMLAVSVDITPSCSPNCNTGAVSWSAPNLWATAADSHTATASVEQAWTGTSGNDKINLNWVISGKVEGRQTSTSSYSSGQMSVRCDREAKATKGPGCVFPEYTPTYVVNSYKDPSAAAYYWIVMQKLPSHPGSRDHNAPLNYLADKSRQEANRDIICPTSGPNKWVGNPVSVIPGKTASCDEYPFAATYQSGGMPPQAVANGKECLQLYSAPLAGGGWTLLEDTTYSRVNTWDEICARASIPNDENSGAPNRMGLHFVPKNRIIDKDKYFLSTPGFEECKDLSQICWFRSRKR
ncbi:hypothetical protein [Streptomyces sp. cg36]|uniref:golvesin C-terminal-like domain-containing protein n=1 Tax=Streptomyces sp. cg36 TaxID=3238798 RepID=UPI0034E22FBE